MRLSSDLLKKRRPGFSGLGMLFFLFLILFLIFIFDMAYIYFSAECMEMDMVECMEEVFASEDEQAPEGSVTATGVISGTYGKSERSVTVTLHFPLEGGDVTGDFSGDCDGNIKGTYAGGNGGIISGTAKGSCAFIMPASGNFSGTVNQTSKIVPVNGEGSIPGFSAKGSLTLKY